MSAQFRVSAGPCITPSILESKSEGQGTVVAITKGAKPCGHTFTCGLRIAQSRTYLCISGLKVDMLYRLGELGIPVPADTDTSHFGPPGGVNEPVVHKQRPVCA